MLALLATHEFNNTDPKLTEISPYYSIVVKVNDVLFAYSVVTVLDII